MGRRNKESAAQRTRQANRDHKRSQQSKPHGRAPLRRSLEDHQGDPHQSDFTPRLIVRSGHVRPLWAGHPWLFPQAVEVIEGDPKDGDEVIVIDAEGEALGRALFSEDSALIARIFTTDPACRFDREWLRGRITAAIALRQTLGLPSAETESYRLIHSEGDGIPGLIVDRFGQVLSAQWLTEGIRRRQALITEVLLELTKADRVIERGQREEASLLFLERGFRYNLPPEITQKTGYYFDQRPLREWVEQHAQGARVFDGHAFVGSMSLAAARGGATSVYTVESSPHAASAAVTHSEINGFDHVIDVERADVRDVLAREGSQNAFDLLLLDPPPYAQRRAHLQRALSGYTKLVELGSRALSHGGVLILSSCSAVVDLDTLQRSVALGAASAGRRALIIERLFQGGDHPTPAAFPEGLYLRTVIARID